MTDFCRQSNNVLDVRRVPIIFVPGVMGSRLHLKTSNAHWDPDSKWRMLHWLLTGVNTCAREMHYTQPAEILGDEDDKSPELSSSEKGRGWSGVVASFYLGFLRFLKDTCFLGAHCPVYAVGYDWRLDIGDGSSPNSCAKYLIDEINRILRREFHDESKQAAIIITHSMGGLVARAALKADKALASKVIGVIHVVQPVNGAPVAYRRFFTGALGDLIEPKALAKILGDTGEKFAAMMHGLPGAMQLIPNNAYVDRRRRRWLSYWHEQNSKWVAYTSDAFDLYKTSSGPPGIIIHAEYDSNKTKYKKPKYKKDLMRQIDRAKQFHSWLGAHRHKRTYAIYSTELTTDMACAFKPHRKPPGSENDSEEAWRAHKSWESWRGMNRQRRDQGDGTVPDTSAGALYPLEREPHTKIPEAFMKPSPNQVSVHGIEHGAAFSSSEIREAVEKWVNRILAESGLENVGLQMGHDTVEPFDVEFE